MSLHQSDAGMIPHRANPYQDHGDINRYPGRVVPEPTVLTMRDVDRMMQAKLADAAREAAEDRQKACAFAWEQGHRHGAEWGREHVGGEIADAIRRGLNHTLRRLGQDRKRTTIQAERDHIEQMAAILRNDIDLLWTFAPKEAR